MTTVTVMTETEARKFRADREAEALRLTSMSKRALEVIEHRLMADQGIQREYGGPHSKDEFVSSVLELRGYTTARLNEAVHAIYHDAVWPDCPYCTGRAS